MDDPKITVSGSDPFATPLERRDPSRRLRGRLAAPVTIWTAGSPEEDAALTVSSMVLAEGEPAHVLGLVGDLTELWDAIERTGAFVVHVLSEDQQLLAELFARRRPYYGSIYDGLDTTESAFGPVINEVATRASCRVARMETLGYSLLVDGVVHEVALGELGRPLVFFRARYRRLSAGP